MSKKNPWLLDEPAEDLPQGFLTFLLSVIAVFLVVCAVIVQDPLIRAMSIIWACIVGGLIMLVSWMIRHYRVIMDEKGVRMGEKYSLTWQQICTAAIIQRGDPRWTAYNSRRSDRHFILLSVEENEKAIDKWTFRLEAAKPGRDIRIPYSYRRRQVVEHYLHMTLPVIRL